MLVRLQREFRFDWTSVNIESDASLVARYRYEIPVIVLDGQLELGAPLSERELRAALL